MIDDKEPITSVALVSNRLLENEGIDLAAPKLKQFIKQELGMRFRISRKLVVQANSQRCLVLR